MYLAAHAAENFGSQTANLTLLQPRPPYLVRQLVESQGQIPYVLPTAGFQIQHAKVSGGLSVRGSFCRRRSFTVFERSNLSGPDSGPGAGLHRSFAVGKRRMHRRTVAKNPQFPGTRYFFSYEPHSAVERAPRPRLRPANVGNAAAQSLPGQAAQSPSEARNRISTNGRRLCRASAAVVRAIVLLAASEHVRSHRPVAGPQRLHHRPWR